MSKRKRKKIGLPPGSVVFTGNRQVEKILIHYLKYSESGFEEKQLDNHSEMGFSDANPDDVDWYDIRGLHDTELLEAIGTSYEIHSLVQEDIADISQRPKFEDYENGTFFIVRSLRFDRKELKVITEQVAIYYRKGLVLSFQETESDLFASVRDRIRIGKSRISKRNSDYLVYAMIDSIVDQYYLLLDEIEDEIEIFEESILESATENVKTRVHHLKKELLMVRKTVIPMREAINRFAKSEAAFLEDRTLVYIRDLFDHTMQVMDTVDGYRDMLISLQDLYNSEIGFKTNQVVQVLTIITTIFVPLSFLAGLYGMNFVNIPELKTPNGYFILVGIMVIIAGSLLLIFKRKKWL